MENPVNAGDTAWVLMSAALVMLMTPALGFFYGGLVRRKNVLATIMHSFFILALVSVVWVLWGYSLAFGPSVGGAGFIGNLEWFGLNGVGDAPEPNYAATIPHGAFMVFQMMFAVITPALITGAFAERKRFKAFALFSVLWVTLVYAPIAHWVWGNAGGVPGWIKALGALDFAGGTVVHISSGMSALVAAAVLGRRIDYGEESYEPHDATMTVLGASLLWFGWFGFNAGSALAAGGGVMPFIVTNTAAAMAALTWTTVSWVHKGRPSVLGAAVGAVAGLVAITPASGYVNPMASIVIGFGAGAICYVACHLKSFFKIDDSLDVWGVHGVGGIWGALATGLFATTAVNATGGNGLFFGNPGQLLVQLIAVAAVAVYASAVTWLLLKLIDITVGLRVGKQEEAAGLDETQHGELAYQI